MSESVRAELAAVAEAIERYRSRVSSLIDHVAENEELKSAMYEAERGLLGASRLVTRAEKLAR